MSEGFAAAGADVVIASRKLDACMAAAQEVEAATGRRALPVSCHVGRWEDCDRLVETVYAEFGRCDVLVNNAGMSPLYDGLPSVTEELYDKVHAVNARGPFRLSALFGSRMAEGEVGERPVLLFRPAGDVIELDDLGPPLGGDLRPAVARVAVHHPDFVAELEKCRTEKAAVAPLANQPPQALRWLKSAISGVRLI